MHSACFEDESDLCTFAALLFTAEQYSTGWAEVLFTLLVVRVLFDCV